MMLVGLNLVSHKKVIGGNTLCVQPPIMLYVNVMLSERVR